MGGTSGTLNISVSLYGPCRRRGSFGFGPCSKKRRERKFNAIRAGAGNGDTPPFRVEDCVIRNRNKIAEGERGRAETNGRKRRLRMQWCDERKEESGRKTLNYDDGPRFGLRERRE